MKSLNNVKLIGNVGMSPELNEVAGKKVLNFSLATSFQKKDESGQSQTITDWHRITAWGKTAETMHQYLKKGTRLMVDGYLKNNVRQEENGKKITQTSIIVEEFLLLSKE